MIGKTHPYIIDHIDPLGQGVYKKDGDIFFIPKTLPGEEGQAKVYRKKSKVFFSSSIRTDKASDKRILAKCPHYNECNGCHFLHTDYQNEIDIKFLNFKRLFSSFTVDSASFNSFAAQERFHYRNRVQLHYNKKEKLLGFINPRSKKIIEVPGCLIIREELKEALKNLYLNWPQLAKNQTPRGHVELYLKYSGDIQMSWNKKYAQGGFSQVNQKMNELLIEHLQSKLSKKHKILDLFAGDGNLSQGFNADCLDYYGHKDSNNHYHADLFSENALHHFLTQNPDKDYQAMIIDPPRKGFPLIKDWVTHFCPRTIILVSCHPQTLIRDLSKIQEQYEFKEISMFDLFPGTFHNEAFVVLERI